MINMFLYRVMSSGFSLCRWYKEILGISQSANFPLASAPKSNKEKKSLSFYSSIFSYSESLCAIIIWSVLFCFQSWPTFRYPDRRQMYAGTLQVSWPASGVCRYPAGILTSVRCIQKLAYWVFLFKVFQSARLGDVCPRKKAPLWVIEPGDLDPDPIRAVWKREFLFELGLRVQGRVRYPLSHRFIPYEAWFTRTHDCGRGIELGEDNSRRSQSYGVIHSWWGAKQIEHSKDELC